jgi:alkylation response protein AidB-like acyl-CoA dehydrogenase
MLAYLDSEVARSLFADDPRAVLANGPGEGNRPGRALPVDGGYRLTGRWNFATGIRHASWLVAVSQLHDAAGRPCLNAEGGPELRQILLPIDQATILDTWHVTGLRGTGSQSFLLENVFVPGERAIHVAPANRREPGPLYQFSVPGTFAPGFGAVALGLAESSLRGLVELAGGKRPRDELRLLRESAGVQGAVGKARARLSAARALLHSAVADAWAEVCELGELSLERRVAIRMAATYAIHEGAAVVDVAYEAAGSHAVFASGPLERRFRDVHTVTQHLQGRANHFEAVGRFALGMDPKSTHL